MTNRPLLTNEPEVPYAKGDEVAGCVVSECRYNRRAGGFNIRVYCPLCNEPFPELACMLKYYQEMSYRRTCPQCRKGTRAAGVRLTKPRSLLTDRVIDLLQKGIAKGHVARMTGLQPQSVEKVWLRWIVLPENESLKAKVAALEARIRELEQSCPS